MRADISYRTTLVLERNSFFMAGRPWGNPLCGEKVYISSREGALSIEEMISALAEDHGNVLEAIPPTPCPAGNIINILNLDFLGYPKIRVDESLLFLVDSKGETSRRGNCAPCAKVSISVPMGCYSMTGGSYGIIFQEGNFYIPRDWTSPTPFNLREEVEKNLSQSNKGNRFEVSVYWKLQEFSGAKHPVL